MDEILDLHITAFPDRYESPWFQRRQDVVDTICHEFWEISPQKGDLGPDEPINGASADDNEDDDEDDDEDNQDLAGVDDEERDAGEDGESDAPDTAYRKLHRRPRGMLI